MSRTSVLGQVPLSPACSSLAASGAAGTLLPVLWERPCLAWSPQREEVVPGVGRDWAGSPSVA